MLQLSDSILTQDLLTNNIIIHFVSERLADCVEPLLQYTPKKLKSYFPPRYKSAKMCPAIQDLYNLLKSNTAYIPPLILEYVLATCIHSTLVSQEDAGLPTIKYLSESILSSIFYDRASTLSFWSYYTKRNSPQN